MREIELESYLTCNGYDSRIGVEVYNTLKRKYYTDLDHVDAERLTRANDTVRMDIRVVADDIYRRRQDIMKSRCLTWDKVPFRVYPE